MNHPPRWMSRPEKRVAGLALAVALAFVAACAGGPERPVPAVFADYPPSAAFDEVIQSHVDAGTDREQRLLLTTWFQDGDPRVARFCSVRPDGRCSTYQYVHQTEFRAPTARQLDPATMGVIAEAIKQLPPSQKPSLANMLIVSFREDGAWQTRLYDRMDRPAAASTIIETTGAPIVP